MINKKIGLIVGALSCALLSFGAVCASQSASLRVAENVNIDTPYLKGAYSVSNGFSGTVFLAPDFSSSLDLASVHTHIVNYGVSVPISSDFGYDSDFYLVYSIDYVNDYPSQFTYVNIDYNTQDMIDWSYLFSTPLWVKALIIPNWDIYTSPLALSCFSDSALYWFENPTAHRGDDEGFYLSFFYDDDNDLSFDLYYAVNAYHYNIFPSVSKVLSNEYSSWNRNLDYIKDQEYTRGRLVGYNEGLSAINSEGTAIMTLFGSIANVPISVLNGLGGLVVWDVPIISILATFVIIALFAWVIRKFI